MKRCTASDLDERGTVSLPVLRDHEPHGEIRRSRSGRRRAAVLATIQILMIVHVVVWMLSRKHGWFGGRTMTPIEPSESMEFVKHGVINAGLVFFAVALLGTLVLGRWVCGWACHLVMLQDLCGWLMRKAGIRPQAFRSRLLIYVPLALALYMFVWPLFYRFAVAPWVRPDLEWPGFSTHFTTTEFWQTFPGVLVAIPFLAICGFATVYFLGSKGFCTYGCPYGGFFAPLDEFAPGRIRVTDACEGCGHCTAVCTSNVRVHEEVREYGMVVDPGCMKCLDCVSVCPKDALYFGFGRPAQIKGAARHETPRRVYDLSWPGEIGCSIVFALVFFAVRGVYSGLIPMLMAAGIAGVVTFLAWKLWRLARDPDVSLHRFQLRADGRLRRAGAVYATITISVLLLCAHSGVVNAAGALGSHYDNRIGISPADVLRPGRPPLDPSTLDDARHAIRLYRFTSPAWLGGIGLAANPHADVRLAWLYCCTGELDAAEVSLRRAIDRLGETEGLARDLARILRARSHDAQANAYVRAVLRRHPAYVHLLEDLVLWNRAEGRIDETIALLETRLERHPDDLATLQWLALLLVETDRLDEGIALLRRQAELDASNPRRLVSLAYALAQRGDLADALSALDRALALDPDDELKAEIARLQRLFGRGG